MEEFPLPKNELAVSRCTTHPGLNISIMIDFDIVCDIKMRFFTNSLNDLQHDARHACG